MERPRLEVADILRRYGEAYRQQHDGSLSTAQRRVMTAIEVCRTAALGGHLERCDCCNYERPCYDSCGNRHCRPRFFLPVRVLSRLFRRLFLTYLEEAFDSGKLRFFSSLEALRDRQAFDRHLDPVRNVKWVVYAKPPFAGPQQVVDYVGRYTHRVAISNHRIVDIEGAEIKFKWRDYRDNNQEKTMTLSADQFIGRLLLHVLPSGFHRIRYYGLLANPHRQEKLEQCRQLLGMAPPTKSSSDPATPENYRDRYERLTGRSLRECPVCHRGHMIPVTNLPAVSSSPAIKDTS